MVDYADIAVRAPVNTLQQVVQNAFASQGFKVEWGGALKGKAEKGSKAANFIGGSLAQYYAVEFEIYQGTDKHTLRLHKANTGLMGGLWGMHKVEKQFNRLVDTISSWLSQQGTYQGSTKQ